MMTLSTIIGNYYRKGNPEPSTERDHRESLLVHKFKIHCISNKSSCNSFTTNVNNYVTLYDVFKVVINWYR